MDRLEQIKNEVAKEKYSCSWIYACSFMHAGDVELLMNEVARRYATEVARHNLERAAEKAQVTPTGNYVLSYEVDKESITSLEIELI